jgi:hypothetical protein
VSNATKDLLIEAIITHEAITLQHEHALRQKWAARSQPDQLVTIRETLEANKTQYGSRVGTILPIPDALKDLFEKIGNELRPPTLREKTA